MSASNLIVNTIKKLQALNIVVIPVRENKKIPAIPQFLQWTLPQSRQYPFSSKQNIGIVLGETSQLMVVDVDNKDRGMETWTELIQQHGEPRTPCENTPSGGLHYYFKYTPRVPQRIVKCHEVGIDILTTGGMVVVSPSSIDGNFYKWREEREIGKMEVQELPSWLLDWILSWTQRNPSSAPASCTETNEQRVSIPVKPATHDKLRIAETLTGMLAPARANPYDHWIDVGYSLFNMLEGDPKGLEMWLEFSKKSPSKFKEGECQQLWAGMRQEGKNVLFAMAKEDTPQAFRTFVHTRFRSIYEGQDGHAQMLKWYLQGNLVTTNESTGEGYLWTAQTRLWVKHKSISISNKCREFLKEMLDTEHAYLQSKPEETYNEKRKQLKNIQRDIQRIRWTTDVYSAVHTAFYDAKGEFERNVNFKHEHLLPILHGKVINLKTLKIRDRTKKDCFSIELQVSFGDPNHEMVKRFVNSVMLQEETRLFLQILSGYCLTATVPDQEIFVLYGDGHNGKSRWTDMMSSILESWAMECNVGIFIKPKSELHCTAIMDLKGKRMAYTMETSQGDELNYGLLKKLSGGDLVHARKLYGEGENFQNKAKLLLCTNHPPVVKSSEEAAITRLKYLCWEAEFVDEPDPNNTRQQKKDRAFIQELQKNHLNDFFAWAAVGAQLYYRKGLPKMELLEKLKQAQVKQADPVAVWADEIMEESPIETDKINVDQLWDKWVDEYGKAMYTKRGFFASLRKYLGITDFNRSHGIYYVLQYRWKGNSIQKV